MLFDLHRLGGCGLLVALEAVDDDEANDDNGDNTTANATADGCCVDR